MVLHEFTSVDRSLQRIEHANGVVAVVNLKTKKFRVTNTPDFGSGWQVPENIVPSTG